MPIRFFTLLLILAMLFPAGVFGAVLHRCGMEKSVSVMSCCQGTENNRSEVDSFDQLSHHCLRVANQIPAQLATVNQKVQLDVADLADIGKNFPVFLRLGEVIYRAHHYQEASYPLCGGALIFLRICSFLI